MPVNHRFITPAKELYSEYNNNEDLRATFSKIKQNISLKNGSSSAYSKTTNNLPAPEVIVEGVKRILHKFPYTNTIETESNEQNLDSLGIADIEERHQLKQELKALEKWEMIKSDFPTLSDEQIANNIDVIDEYYTQNLSYVTLNEIANNQKVIQAKVSTNKHNLMSRSLNDFIACAVDNIVLIFGYNPVKALTAATIGTDQAETTATNYYNSANGIPIGAVDTAKNAYKHMAWNALLAQNYFTISSKANRLKFAKDFTDRHEFCGTNPDDSKEMDFHNNAIGRQVWDANTSYRRVAGVTVGLNTLSNTALKSKLRERIDRRSCFIVKTNENRFPENLITNNKGIPEIKNKILATDNTRPVYFVGPIIESTVYWDRVFLRYDFVPCGPDDNPEEGEDTGEGGVILCERAIYTNVRREITPCYQL